MKTGIDKEKFVRCWQKASSVAEVSAEMGISHVQAYRFKNYLRNKGVRLKNFIGGRPGRNVDWKALAALAESVKPEPETAPTPEKGLK